LAALCSIRRRSKVCQYEVGLEKLQLNYKWNALRGFENVCAHRFYPLRTKDKGNGPIRCGFHHWQNSKDGLAVGIPKCQELYGVSPRELDARLKPVEIAIYGSLRVRRVEMNE